MLCNAREVLTILSICGDNICPPSYNVQFVRTLVLLVSGGKPPKKTGAWAVTTTHPLQTVEQIKLSMAGSS